MSAHSESDAVANLQDADATPAENRTTEGRSTVVAANPAAVRGATSVAGDPPEEIGMRATSLFVVPNRIRIWAVMMCFLLALLGLHAVFSETRFVPALTGDMATGVLLALFLTALVCEFVDSSLGMGYGTTLTPLLLLFGFEPLHIVPAVLLSEFCTGLAAGLLHHRDGNVDLLRDKKVRKTVMLLSVLSAVGAVSAAALALTISKFWLTAIIAIIILSVGFVVLGTIRQQLKYRTGHIVALGAVAAFNKGLSGGGYGPLVTGGQVVSGMTAKQAIAVTSLAEALTCAVGLGAYFLLARSIDWSLAIPLTAGAMMSVPLATLTVRRLPEPVMRGCVGIATCVLGLLMVAKLIW